MVCISFVACISAQINTSNSKESTEDTPELPNARANGRTFGNQKIEPRKGNTYLIMYVFEYYNVILLLLIKCVIPTILGLKLCVLCLAIKH